MRSEKFSEVLKEYIKESIKISVTSLSEDVKRKIKEAYDIEDGLSKVFLRAIIENIELAEKERVPICQDTGTFSFYVERGKFNEFTIKSAIEKALREATEEVPLRPNAIDFLSKKNLGNNIGRFVPWIVWKYPKQDELKITVVPKGGGSEVISYFNVFPPTVSYEEIFEGIVKHIKEIWAKPCPPIFLGVGIGATVEIATNLASEALFTKEIGKRNEDKEIAKFEEELIDRINKLGIGTHGLGGKISVLDVHVEYASIHPASLAVVVLGSCWALRRAILVVKESGEAEIVSHNIKLA